MSTQDMVGSTSPVFLATATRPVLTSTLKKAKVTFPGANTPPIQLIEYTSAINENVDPNDPHLRDFVFHIGANSDGNFIVTADNNANYGTDFPGGSDHPITTIVESGWYTFKHDFHRKQQDGTLEVTMSVHKRGVTAPLGITWTRNTSTDIIDTLVAGNRYGFFTYNGIADLPIDNVIRSGGAIVKQASECTGNVYLTVFKKDYKPFTSQKECTDYLKKKLRV